MSSVTVKPTEDIQSVFFLHLHSHLVIHTILELKLVCMAFVGNVCELQYQDVASMQSHLLQV